MQSYVVEFVTHTQVHHRYIYATRVMFFSYSRTYMASIYMQIHIYGRV
jgi:hypothetical protein